MLITKFNKMIKSKILLILLAFIIVLAFIAVPVATQLMKNKYQSSAEGELNGEDVSRGEFLRARHYELRLRRDLNLTPEENKYIRTLVWARLAALRQAHTLGVSVSNKEIAAYLQRDQAFHVNNRFNRDRYREILMRMKIAEHDYELYMRQELILRKLSDVLASTLWIPHSEANDRASSLMDYFVVEYIHMSVSNTITDVTASNTEIKEYYEDNKEYFKTEKKINVRYIQFPASDYFAQSKISTTTVEQHYYDNIDDYSSIDTNDVSVPTPLEDVKEEIAHQLKLKKALNSAAVKASELVESMMPKRYSKTKGGNLEDAALAFDVKIHTSEFFTNTEPIPGTDTDLMSSRIAFSLDPDDDEHYFSDALFGTSNVYVIATQDTVEPAIPEYDDIKDRMRPIVETELKFKRFYEKTSSTRDTLAKGIKEGKKLEDMAKNMALNVSTTETFNVYEGSISNDIEYADTLIPSVLAIGTNELSEAIDTEDGVLLMCVTERTPADALSVMAMKPQVMAMIERYRASIVYNDWLNANLAKANLVDHVAKRREELDALKDEEEEKVEKEEESEEATPQQ